MMQKQRMSQKLRLNQRCKATHGHSTTRTEYQVETVDIRVVSERESSGKQDSNEASSRQKQFDKL